MLLEKQVWIELDVGLYDKYHRLLAYLYIGEVMINAELVKAGLARTSDVAPNHLHRAWMRALEAEALREKRGMWGD